MTTSIAAITFDCTDAMKVGTFWSKLLDIPLDTEPVPSQFFTSIGRTEGSPSRGITMMFINVPEPKTVKNRVHLDLQVDDVAVETERLIGLGAKVVHSKDEWGVEWTTLSDPEGNEFCIACH